MVKKIASLGLSLVFLSLMVLPVSAGTSVTISGNGPLSTNVVGITQIQTGVITQTNHARFSNTVFAGANTGGNTAAFNTGGSTAIITGGARVGVGIRNRANFNWAKLDLCCDNGGSWCDR